jgi:uncharacterized FlaG/YvyC family protein
MPLPAIPTSLSLVVNCDGVMKLLVQIILLGIMAISLGCKRSPAPDEKDAKIRQLQMDVERLSRETQDLRKEISSLRQRVTEQGELQTRAAAESTASSRSEMNVERMKREVSPTLQEIIQKMKKETDTTKQGSQFGMRTEYDTKRAVYGLVRSENPAMPYLARVIVSYQKFLESEKESRAISKGTTRFLFAYRKNRWTFEKIE